MPCNEQPAGHRTDISEHMAVTPVSPFRKSTAGTRPFIWFEMFEFVRLVVSSE